MFQTTNQHLIYWWYTFQRTNRPYHELGVGSSFPRKLADCWGLDLLGWQWESTIHFLCLFQANMVPAHPCFGQTHICYIIMFLVEMPNAGVTVPFSRRPFSLANPWVSMSMSNFWKVEVHSNSTNPLCYWMQHFGFTWTPHSWYPNQKLSLAWFCGTPEACAAARANAATTCQCWASSNQTHAIWKGTLYFTSTITDII